MVGPTKRVSASILMAISVALTGTGNLLASPIGAQAKFHLDSSGPRGNGSSGVDGHQANADFDTEDADILTTIDDYPTVNGTDVHSGPDFVEARWGDTVEDVRRAIGSSGADVLPGGLRVARRIDGRDVLITYDFASGKLVGGEILVQSKGHARALHYWLRETISAMCGGSATFRRTWSDPIYDRSYRDEDVPMRSGRLAYRSVWKTPRSRILLKTKLSGNSGRFDSLAVCRSVSFARSSRSGPKK